MSNKVEATYGATPPFKEIDLSVIDMALASLGIDNSENDISSVTIGPIVVEVLRVDKYPGHDLYVSDIIRITGTRDGGK